VALRRVMTKGPYTQCREQPVRRGASGVGNGAPPLYCVCNHRKEHHLKMDGPSRDQVNWHGQLQQVSLALGEAFRREASRAVPPSRVEVTASARAYQSSSRQVTVTHRSPAPRASERRAGLGTPSPRVSRTPSLPCAPPPTPPAQALTPATPRVAMTPPAPASPPRAQALTASTPHAAVAPAGEAATDTPAKGEAPGAGLLTKLAQVWAESYPKAHLLASLASSLPPVPPVQLPGHGLQPLPTAAPTPPLTHPALPNNPVAVGQFGQLPVRHGWPGRCGQTSYPGNIPRRALLVRALLTSAMLATPLRRRSLRVVPAWQVPVVSPQANLQPEHLPDPLMACSYGGSRHNFSLQVPVMRIEAWHHSFSNSSHSHGEKARQVTSSGGFNAPFVSRASAQGESAPEAHAKQGAEAQSAHDSNVHQTYDLVGGRHALGPSGGGFDIYLSSSLEVSQRIETSTRYLLFWVVMGPPVVLCRSAAGAHEGSGAANRSSGDCSSGRWRALS
jgi:hypothetical protein